MSDESTSVVNQNILPSAPAPRHRGPHQAEASHEAAFGDRTNRAQVAHSTEQPIEVDVWI